MALAEAWPLLDDARREAHGEQRRSGRLLAGAHGGRRRVREQQVAKVLLVHGDAVRGGGSAGLCAQLGADGDAGGEADDGDAHAVARERADRGVDVAGVRGQQGAEDDDDLARAVRGRVEERGARHLERVLQRRVALWVRGRLRGQSGDVVRRVARQVAEADGQAVAHAEHAELRDGVLLEEFGDKVLSVAEGEKVAAGAHVLFGHGGAEVDDEDDVPDDAALERGGVFE